MKWLHNENNIAAMALFKCQMRKSDIIKWKNVYRTRKIQAADRAYTQSRKEESEVDPRVISFSYDLLS